jgi:hypothetical protein
MVKKVSAIVFLFIMGFVTGSFAKDQQVIRPSLSPVIFVPQSHYEFPGVIDGMQVSHEFTVENKGTAPLIIQKVETG